MGDSSACCAHARIETTRIDVIAKKKRQERRRKVIMGSLLRQQQRFTRYGLRLGPRHQSKREATRWRIPFSMSPASAADRTIRSDQPADVTHCFWKTTLEAVTLVTV